MSAMSNCLPVLGKIKKEGRGRRKDIESVFTGAAIASVRSYRASFLFVSSICSLVCCRIGRLGGE